MDLFLALIGGGTILYGLGYLIALLLLDCDLHLGFCEKFGKSASKLKGKVVFITGASSGIGENIAKYLSKYGVKLVLAARRNDELERVKASCVENSKGLLTDNDVLVIQMDVTDLASHEKHFNTAIQHFGQVDILVNNAGRSQRAEWENIDIAVDKQMFELNVFGVVHLSRIAIKHFNAKGSGQIAVVSSVTGVIGAPFSATYTGSKHALHGYFDALRTEKIGKNISVTLLCPGPTYTNFLKESFTDKEGEKYGVAAQQSRRRMTPERCAQLCSIAITNKLNEAWIGVFPLILFMYMSSYFPVTFNFLMNWIGPNKLMSFRDTENSSKLTEDKKSD